MDKKNSSTSFESSTETKDKIIINTDLALITMCMYTTEQKMPDEP